MAKETNQVGDNSQTLPAGLYVVATPIGNLADISLRALDVLKKAQRIACEDTRVTGKLLMHYGITTRTLQYHEHNAEQMRPKILEALSAGEAIALVSDAGTPLISDPGYKLVHEAREQGFAVYPIPGASSVMAALCASGLPTNRFLFAGFLSAKGGARKQEIEELADVDATLVFFESARRLADTLAALAETMPGRQAAVAREMTKLFEEFHRASVQELAAHYASAAEPKGEVVIVIAPPEARVAQYDATAEALLRSALETLSVKEAAAKVAKQTGLSRNELYDRALDIKGRR